MLMLKFWQSSSINTTLLNEHSVICGAEKVCDESDKGGICWNFRISKWKCWQLHYHGLLSGSTVEVKETMARFTTDVIASCAFGINSNSVKDPDAEIGRKIRNILDFSVTKGLAMLTAFFAPQLQKMFRLKVMDDKTDNYVRQIVWNTVEYRWEKYCFTYAFNETVLKTLCLEKFSSPSV